MTEKKTNDTQELAELVKYYMNMANQSLTAAMRIHKLWDEFGENDREEIRAVAQEIYDKAYLQSGPNKSVGDEYPLCFGESWDSRDMDCLECALFSECQAVTEAGEKPKSSFIGGLPPLGALVTIYWNGQSISKQATGVVTHHRDDGDFTMIRTQGLSPSIRVTPSVHRWVYSEDKNRRSEDELSKDFRRAELGSQITLTNKFSHKTIGGRLVAKRSGRILKISDGEKSWDICLAYWILGKVEPAAEVADNPGDVDQDFGSVPEKACFVGGLPPLGAPVIVYWGGRPKGKQFRGVVKSYDEDGGFHVRHHSDRHLFRAILGTHEWAYRADVKPRHKRVVLEDHCWPEPGHRVTLVNQYVDMEVEGELVEKDNQGWSFKLDEDGQINEYRLAYWWLSEVTRSVEPPPTEFPNGQPQLNARVVVCPTDSQKEPMIGKVIALGLTGEEFMIRTSIGIVHDVKPGGYTWGYAGLDTFINGAPIIDRWVIATPTASSSRTEPVKGIVSRYMDFCDDPAQSGARGFGLSNCGIEWEITAFNYTWEYATPAEDRTSEEILSDFNAVEIGDRVELRAVADDRIIRGTLCNKVGDRTLRPALVLRGDSSSQGYDLRSWRVSQIDRQINEGTPEWRSIMHPPAPEKN